MFQPHDYDHLSALDFDCLWPAPHPVDARPTVLRTQNTLQDIQVEGTTPILPSPLKGLALTQTPVLNWLTGTNLNPPREARFLVEYENEVPKKQSQQSTWQSTFGLPPW